MYFKRYISIAVVSLLAACGGGDDDNKVAPEAPPPAPRASAEGLWEGTTSSGRTIRTLVLGDGTYWSLYSAVDAPGIVAGVVQGVGNTMGGSFSSSSARDFNIEASTVLEATLSASFATKAFFNGSLSYLTLPETVAFTSTYQAAYDQTPLLGNLTGTYAGTAATNLGTDTATLTVSTTGAVAGTSSDGCQFAGTAAPREKGNAFDVSLTFRGGSCANGTSTMRGVAYLDGSGLYSAVLDSARSNGAFITATKISSTVSVPTTTPPAVTVPSTGSSSGSAITTGNSSGCGSRGGPGYRKANGQCASWADYYAGRR